MQIFFAVNKRQEKVCQLVNSYSKRINDRTLKVIVLYLHSHDCLVFSTALHFTAVLSTEVQRKNTLEIIYLHLFEGLTVHKILSCE